MLSLLRHTIVYMMCSGAISSRFQLCRILNAFYLVIVAAAAVADGIEGNPKHIIIRNVYLFQIECCECQSICMYNGIARCSLCKRLTANMRLQKRRIEQMKKKYVHVQCLCTYFIHKRYTQQKGQKTRSGGMFFLFRALSRSLLFFWYVVRVRIKRCER